MQKYNINANLAHPIEQLYDNAIRAVQMNDSTGEWFRTIAGVRQGCLLTPTLFNFFPLRVMSDALEEYDERVSIGDRTIANLRFVDDIDALAIEEQELEARCIKWRSVLKIPNLFQTAPIASRGRSRLKDKGLEQ